MTQVQVGPHVLSASLPWRWRNDLDDLWMSAMWEALKDDWLLAVVRFAGVAVGILGTAIASPDAARAVGRTVRSYAMARWSRLQALLHMPQRRDIYLADGVSGSDAFGSVTVNTEASGSVWSDDPAQQLEILRQRTESLDRALQAVRIANHNDLAGIRAEIAALRSEHTTAFDDLRAEQEERDRQTIRFNARGLPLIGASIILSGLPDPVVSTPWFAWPLLVGAAIATIAVVRGPSPT